jgi:hypothetical protein
VVTDEPVLRKRPIIQIVEGFVLAKRPGGSPTSIAGAGTLQKRPVVQNDSRIVEGRAGLEKWPVMNPTMIQDASTLQKRPVIGNGNPAVEAHVLQKQPVGNPTLIEVAGTLQKRPVIKNDNLTVEGPVPEKRRVRNPARRALQNCPEIRNGGASIEAGSVGNWKNDEGSVLEKRPEIKNSSNSRA